MDVLLVLIHEALGLLVHDDAGTAELAGGRVRHAAAQFLACLAERHAGLAVELETHPGEVLECRTGRLGHEQAVTGARGGTLVGHADLLGHYKTCHKLGIAQEAAAGKQNTLVGLDVDDRAIGAFGLHAEHLSSNRVEDEVAGRCFIQHVYAQRVHSLLRRGIHALATRRAVEAMGIEPCGVGHAFADNSLDGLL